MIVLLKNLLCRALHISSALGRKADEDSYGDLGEMPKDDGPEIDLKTDVLQLPEPPQGHRICIDFGTAMSKVALVRDETDEREYEDIKALELGVPGDQEEISRTMLVSSVFIDNGELLRFGQSAVEYAKIESQSSQPGERQRLDNIKQYLSGEDLNNKVEQKFNPTEVNITYRDMVLAYLMFLTWAMNRCLEREGEPLNLPRRFAMPCFKEGKALDVERELKSMIGEAQILADTFSGEIETGVSLSSFMKAVKLLRQRKLKFAFVQDSVTEPLGAVGSLMSWRKDVISHVMAIDVGAGTSDFGLYRIIYSAQSGEISSAGAIEGQEGITEAGNSLDKILKGFILGKAKVDSTHAEWGNIQGDLELNIRDYKERMFEGGWISARLFNDEVVSVNLSEFLSSPQVVEFGKSLKTCRDTILKRVDPSFIRGAPWGVLTVMLTGGGAKLPMVKELAEGEVEVGGKSFPLQKTKYDVPKWLLNDFPELEQDYPRIAVSIGGARKKIINLAMMVKQTADVEVAPKIGGYYTKGK